MLVIPAIDIKEGCVVRFVQGRLNKKIYSRDPVKTAKHWAMQGAKLIHVVDLDGAETGIPRNLALVKAILKGVDVPVQFGGGVRKIELIKELIACGIWRVILGTKAAQDEPFLKKAFKLFKEKVIVSIDAKDDQVLIKGWQSCCKNISLLAFAKSLKEIGFGQLIYTDTSKDGTLSGSNIRGLNKLLREIGIGVIASGGVSCLDDIRKLKLIEKKGLAGVIVGKALYEGRFTLPQALKAA